MKFNSYFIWGIVFGLLVSCDKSENRVTIKGGTAPVLTVSSTADLVLLKSQENFSSLQFQWSNPNYEFSNGVNTQNVFYTLQIDTTGSNFTNPKIISIGFTNSVNRSFTVKDLNNSLSGLELKDFVPHNFEFRIKATLASGSVPIYSNVVKIKITTYLDVVYPVPANLFIIGDATPAVWTNTTGALDPSQKFTAVNAYTFQISSIALTGGKYFLFLPVAGSWDRKYAFPGSKNSNNKFGDLFKPDSGEDILAPDASGNYKVTVNFKTGKYSLEKL